jgi:alkylhydroperoxidase/carboxymuconolactone decarboxylase family protein YurZ
MCPEKNEGEMRDKILRAIEKEYGFVPLVNEVLSERPDLFIPVAGAGRSVFTGRGELDKKVSYLNALAAATALGAEHCIKVQIDQAVKAGATRNEILETMQIAAVMSMTHAQSYAFRKFRETFPKDE